MRPTLLIVSTLVCALAWWLGAVVGLAVSLLTVAGLALTRHAARRAVSPSFLAAMPVWQVFLPAVLGLPAGIGLSFAVLVFGPGF